MLCVCNVHYVCMVGAIVVGAIVVGAIVVGAIVVGAIVWCYYLAGAGSNKAVITAAIILSSNTCKNHCLRSLDPCDYHMGRYHRVL